MWERLAELRPRSACIRIDYVYSRYGSVPVTDRLPIVATGLHKNEVPLRACGSRSSDILGHLSHVTAG